MKYLNLLILLAILESCNKPNDNSKTIKLVNKEGKVLLLGDLKNDTIPNGLWTFYNDDEREILQIDFNYEKQTHNIFIKDYNKDGKIIRDAYYSNGKLIEEKSCEDFKEVDYANGRYLFNHYLESYYYNEFGKIIKNKLTLEILIDRIKSLRKKYGNIPDFTPSEIRALLCYLNPEGSEVRP